MIVSDDDFQRRCLFSPFYARPEWTDRGLLVGAGTCLLRPATSARDDDVGEHILTVLSVASEQPVTKSALGHIEAARVHWLHGDRALAHIRLALAQLPSLTKVGAYRAFLAARILADMPPAALRKHVGLIEPEDVAKFDPSQPRVPAGSGQESGRWTSGSVSALSAASPLIHLVGKTTTNFDYACRVLKIDPIDAGNALHAAKDGAYLGGADNCTFDLQTGDIFFDGEHIGNLRD